MNFNILALWQYLVANGSFKEIRHIFPLSGYTMMPCDRDFGDIERTLRKNQCIYTPSQYVNLIKDARVKIKFQVTEMARDEFVDITPLASALTKRTVTTEKVKVDYQTVHQFRISQERPQQLEVKLSHDDGEEWKQISLKKRGGRAKLQEVQLSPRYGGSRPIPEVKVDDVKSLLEYVPPIYHQFYNDIVVDNNRRSNTDDIELMDDPGDCD